MTRRVHHPDAPRLADLVGDVGAARRALASGNVPRTPARPAPDVLAALGTAEDLWTEVLERGVRAPGFRVVREGTTLTRGSVTRRAGMGNRSLTDVVSPNRVLEEHERGATVVLQGIHQTVPRLARTTTNLALDLDQRAQVNAYLSPASSRGLDLHFDHHDVVVVQLGGEKRWRVWDRLDRARHPVRGAPDMALPTFDEVGDPAVDRVLRPGDCLLIPRGCPHAPETVDQESVHLTIGLVAFTRRQLIEQALRRLHGVAATSASIPAGLLGGPAGPGPDGPVADEALEALAAGLDGHDLRVQLARETWRRQPPTRLRRRSRATVADDTTLAVTPGPLVWATTDDDGVVLGLGDRLLHLPIETWPLVSHAVTVEPEVSIRSAHPRSGLDLDSVRTVLTRLVTEGVLAPAAGGSR